jgi:hypothetical protein
MRVLNSLAGPCFETCNPLGSMFSGVKWWSLHLVVNYEYFKLVKSPFILGVSLAWVLVPLAVAQTSVLIVKVIWSTEFMSCCDIFWKGNPFSNCCVDALNISYTFRFSVVLDDFESPTFKAGSLTVNITCRCICIPVEYLLKSVSSVPCLSLKNCRKWN